MTPLDSVLRDLLREVVRDVVEDVVRAEVVPLVTKLEPRAEAQATADRISTKDAAKTAGVCEETIRNWIRQGRLRQYRAGRLLRVDRGELERFLANGGADRAKVIDVKARAAEIIKSL